MVEGDNTREAAGVAPLLETAEAGGVGARPNVREFLCVNVPARQGEDRAPDA